MTMSTTHRAAMQHGHQFQMCQPPTNREELYMATTIGFETVQDYLSGFAAKGTISNSPHKSFWKVRIVGGVSTPVSYDDFISGTIPHVTYDGFSGSAGQPIPIIWK